MFLFVSEASLPSYCRVESNHCSFPFQHGGGDKFECVENADGDKDDYYCKQNPDNKTEDGTWNWDGRWNWAKCNSGCLEYGSKYKT
jgi:hypothetical protein